MRSKRSGFLCLGLSYLALALPFFLPNPLMITSQSFEPAPLWWEINLDLKTHGEYKLEGKDSAVTGKYGFSIRWTGCLEREDQDYLLYHFDSRLSRWEAQETSSSPRAAVVLTTPDFKEKPFLNLKYILRKDNDLFLDFLVDGMVVPQNGSEDSFTLLFPSTQENGQRNLDVDYNACVVAGSNCVSLKESEIYVGPVTKDYSWTWKHQAWQLKERRTVFTAQSHRAEVSLSLIPRYTRPK
jgi:hypothetical protein